MASPRRAIRPIASARGASNAVDLPTQPLGDASITCRSVISHGRATRIDTLTGVNLALAIERQVVGIFADQHVRQQARPGAATLDGARR